MGPQAHGTHATPKKKARRTRVHIPRWPLENTRRSSHPEDANQTISDSKHICRCS